MSRRYIPALGFDALTPCLDLALGAFGYGGALHGRILAALRPRAGETLLDVGCGSGALLRFARRRSPSARLVGLDVDAAVLRLALAKSRPEPTPIQLVQAPADDLPFGAGSFDAVVSSLAFHHLATAEKRAAVGEIYRVLKPGGRFLLADIGPADTRLARLVYRVVRAARLPEAERVRDHVEGKLPAFLAAAGFTVEAAGPRYHGVALLLAWKGAA